MATTNISVHSMVDLAVKAYQNYQYPTMSLARKNQIIPICKYNLCVSGFNCSSVLLVASAVAATFFAFYASAILIGFGVSMRFASEIGIKNLTMPPVVDQNGAGDAEPLARAALHALGSVRADLFPDRILRLLGAQADATWHANKLVVAGHVIFKNSVAVPEN